MRLRFKDNEVLEGMMPNDLSQTSAEGFLINPPDLRGNTQRIFVPRTALESLTPGIYIVEWQALTADTHRTEGAFIFRVGQ